MKPSDDTSTPPARPRDDAADFAIVGIGASAGGLAAFEAFFAAIPPEPALGMAFVLVQHLDPNHPSMLVELIKRFTCLPVFEVTDGVVVQPECVYIIPPGHDMAFLNGTLQLLPPAAPRGQRLPIDYFFRSLARDQHERAIGIVFSGTGSDGTLGVRAIKGEGGMVMVQNPASTEYDGMSRSAIATGMVDFELRPAEMPEQLITYVAYAFRNRPRMETRGSSMPKSDSALMKIFVLVRSQTGRDFSEYKPSTIYRRIERRMAVHQIEKIEQYVLYLQHNPVEVDLFFHDLLIGVTSFFRDPEAFQALEEKVIPRLFDDKPAGGAIRVWVPGCSSGEEAYSLAMLLHERLEALKQGHTLQIFATDIDGGAIALGRAGCYPANIVADLTPERLKRFFVAEPNGGGYRIHKNIRDAVVFSVHDVIMDPPFSRLDLISCRNLLIYMNASLQEKVMALFHYALKPGGRLFLGSSESVDKYDEFAVLDRKAKLYQRKEAIYQASRAIGDHFGPILARLDAPPKLGPHTSAVPLKQSPRELTEHALLQQVVQAGALVNGRGDIIYIHGRTGRYLELATGEAGVNNIVKTAREGLRGELTKALQQAVLNNATVCCPGLRVKTNSHFTALNLTISPVVRAPSALPEMALYLVVLEEAAAEPVPVEGGGGQPPAELDASLVALQQELRSKEEVIQGFHEQLESATEELKSSNEEMQSVNEELQSSNEELMTAKEELQSINEELFTVNTELQVKVADLSRVNNDMNNLLAGTGIGTLFVDQQLRILRFTPPLLEIINLLPGDAGRPVSTFDASFGNYRNLVPDIQTVLNTLMPIEIEVQCLKGKWFLMRILPYRTVNNVIEGAAITFVDITELRKLHVDLEVLRQAEVTLQKSEARFRRLFMDAPVGIALIESQTGIFCDVNPMFAKIAGRSAPELIGRDWMSITHPADVQGDLDQMARLNAGKIERFQMEKRYLRPDETVVWISMTVASVKECDPATPRHLSMIEDITERKRGEEALRKANDLLRLAVVVRDAHDAITLQDLDGRMLAWNPAAVRMYGWSEAEALQMNVRERIPAGMREDALAKIMQLSRAETLEPHRTQRIAKDGAVVEVSVISTALVDAAGNMYAVATNERVMGRAPH
jgi:two-component system CheB/CheR fusion protein